MGYMPFSYEEDAERKLVVTDENRVRLHGISYEEVCLPMAKEIVMPKMGDEMTEGKLVTWLKREGSTISKGEPLAEIEADKVTVEIEAPETGVLQRLLVAEGQLVPVGEALALIVPEAEAQAREIPAPHVQASPFPKAQTGKMATSHPASAPTALEAPRSVRPGEEREPASGISRARPSVAVIDTELSSTRVKASPLARRIAQAYGVDLMAIHGSGPGGRVVRFDVESEMEKGLFAPLSSSDDPRPQPVPSQEAWPTAHAEPASALPADEQILTRLQQTMARRMLESKTHAPHFYLTCEIDVTETMALRARLNQQVDADEKISVNDLVLKAVAKTLSAFPILNASFAGDRLLLHKEISLAVAIAMRNGLVTPVLRHVDEKAIGQIARETRGLIERARSGKSRVEDYATGTFTVSNLGMYGIDTFHAIINPPQAAILAVGAIRRIPVYIGDDLIPRERIHVTLSADHRVTDGATGAQFLSHLRGLLENPLRLLV